MQKKETSIDYALVDEFNLQLKEDVRDMFINTNIMSMKASPLKWFLQSEYKDVDLLGAEYDLIQRKKSKLSRSQRDVICDIITMSAVKLLNKKQKEEENKDDE